MLAHAAAGASLALFLTNSTSLAASSDPISANVATAIFTPFSKSNPPQWSQQSENFYQGLQEDKDGSTDEHKLGGRPPRANHSNNNAASENHSISKFKIESNLKPSTPGPATNHSSQPQPPKRVGHSSLSESNKRPKTLQHEPRDKTFLFDVEILYANDTKHHMQSPSSSWEGNIGTNARKATYT